MITSINSRMDRLLLAPRTIIIAARIERHARAESKETEKEWAWGMAMVMGDRDVCFNSITFLIKFFVVEFTREEAVLANLIIRLRVLTHLSEIEMCKK